MPNMTFNTGPKPVDDIKIGPGNTHDMIFKSGDLEVLRIDHNGDFWIKGRRVTNDKIVYHAFREWVKKATGH